MIENQNPTWAGWGGQDGKTARMLSTDIIPLRPIYSDIEFLLCTGSILGKIQRALFTLYGHPGRAWYHYDQREKHLKIIPTKLFINGQPLTWHMTEIQKHLHSLGIDVPDGTVCDAVFHLTSRANRDWDIIRRFFDIGEGVQNGHN